MSSPSSPPLGLLDSSESLGSRAPRSNDLVSESASQEGFLKFRCQSRCQSRSCGVSAVCWKAQEAARTGIPGLKVMSIRTELKISWRSPRSILFIDDAFPACAFATRKEQSGYAEFLYAFFVTNEEDLDLPKGEPPFLLTLDRPPDPVVLRR